VSPPLNNTPAPPETKPEEKTAAPAGGGGENPFQVGLTPGQRDAQRESAMNSARVVVKFAEEKNVLMSGLLAAPAEIAGKAAVVDCPVGKGHVVIFAIRPFWRAETQGSYAMVWNAIMNYENLNAGRTAPEGGGEGRRGR
jgi:hypothetical protein